MTQEFVSLRNTEYENFIFDVHLYKFEYFDGEPQFSIAIQCPTKSFPRLYLRVPAFYLYDHVSVVTVHQRPPTSEYTYNLTSVQSISRGMFNLKLFQLLNITLSRS